MESFRVIFDSGCSLAISPNREDFIGDLRCPIQDLRLGGMANGMLIEGIGVVEWSFESLSGATVTIKTECYYVPASKVRLISPQRLFNSSRGISGEFICREDEAELKFKDSPALKIAYDSRSHLPIAQGHNSSATSSTNIVLSHE
jgi:hypothetical protein